jgi:hypothetical protein
MTDRDLLVEAKKLRGRNARAVVQERLQSPDEIERAIAMRILLDRDGWSASLGNKVANDRCPLLRSDVATWLYLHGKFAEWDLFLTDTTSHAQSDYEQLKPRLAQFSKWREVSAGASLLGIGQGLDRYITELLRRNREVAEAASRDVLNGESAVRMAALQWLASANRPDFEAGLRQLVERARGKRNRGFGCTL